MIRVGHGYDVHKLVSDRPLMLGCVRVPYEKGLLGHSDADVLSHAIADALLGAAALGDLGKHFPDTDPQYSGMSGESLLSRVRVLLESARCQISNIDATIVAQAPKLAPYLPEMRRALAAALQIDPEQVSVKATTEEGLGITGTKEAICAHAVALITK